MTLHPGGSRLEVIELAAPAPHRPVQHPDALRGHRHDALNRTLPGFLDRLMAARAARRQARVCRRRAWDVLSAHRRCFDVRVCRRRL